MTTGEKIRTLRESQGLSQDALAEKVNASRQTISKWERNCVLPDSENLLKLCRVFSVSMDSFFSVQLEEKKSGSAFSPPVPVAPKQKEEKGKSLLCTSLCFAAAILLCFWVGFSSVFLLVCAAGAALIGWKIARPAAETPAHRRLAKFGWAGAALGLVMVAFGLPIAKVLAQPGKVEISYGHSPAEFSEQSSVEEWVSSLCRISEDSVQVYQQSECDASGEWNTYYLIYRRIPVETAKCRADCAHFSLRTELHYISTTKTEKNTIEQIDLVRVSGKSPRTLEIWVNEKQIPVLLYPYGSGDIRTYFNI
jgi:transcriptional regulator with XRE-family HTH domain